MKTTSLAVLSLLALGTASQAVILHGITTENELVSFDSSTPSVFISSSMVSGLFASDGTTPDPLAFVANLSYNPTTGQFFGIDSNANFYSLSSNGVATLLNNTFAPGGFDAGMSYDPFTGGFLYADDSAESYNLSTAGMITQNASLFYGTGDANEASTPSIFGVGVDPDFGIAYYLDSMTGSLAQGFDPTSGEIFTIGSLNTPVTGLGGLTVDFDGNLWAALSGDGLTSELYSIDPLTGAATSGGSFGTGLVAISVPEPSTALLGLVGTIALLRRRRA